MADQFAELFAGEIRHLSEYVVPRTRANLESLGLFSPAEISDWESRVEKAITHLKVGVAAGLPDEELRTRSSDVAIALGNPLLEARRRLAEQQKD